MGAGTVTIAVNSSQSSPVTLDQMTTILGFVVEIDPAAVVELTTWKLELRISAAKFVEALGSMRPAPTPQVQRPIDVFCSKCMASPGEVCRVRSGNVASHPHKLRVRRAER